MGLHQGKKSTKHPPTSRDLGSKDTLQVVEMRVRELEEEGWTTAFTDKSGLNIKQ